MESISQLFHVDRLAAILVGLIILVLATVLSFSKRYMAGDTNAGRQSKTMVLLGVCALTMVLADHVVLLIIAWTLSNLLLVRLMQHKTQWQAANYSGRLALGTFALGTVMLASALWILSNASGSTSIQGMLARANSLEAQQASIALLLILLAALTQSAAWPFHRWLLSSLNSPTPVSALMHAGLVNGGGYLLVRFSPLYANHLTLLHVMFLFGLITAVIGTTWKLIQTDIKRMLACSTMGQMGFMIMQCGMGLFAPAISHLVWHGLFKAYLFLSVGSTVRDKRGPNQFGQITSASFALACVLGAAGASAFMLIGNRMFHHRSFDFGDTSAILVGLAFITSTQIASRALQNGTKGTAVVAALVLSCAAGSMYAVSLCLVEQFLAPIHLAQPQPMDALYATGFAIIAAIWLAMNLTSSARLQGSNFWKRLYVASLNGSQPHPETITATRTAYQY